MSRLLTPITDIVFNIYYRHLSGGTNSHPMTHIQDSFPHTCFPRVRAFRSSDTRFLLLLSTYSQWWELVGHHNERLRLRTFGHSFAARAAVFFLASFDEGKRHREICFLRSGSMKCVFFFFFRIRVFILIFKSLVARLVGVASFFLFYCCCLVFDCCPLSSSLLLSGIFRCRFSLQGVELCPAMCRCPSWEDD